MKRFKNILVVAPLDVDMTKPMRAAAGLAGANQARITVYDVIEPVRTGRRILVRAPGAGDFQEALQDARRTELQEVAALAPNVPVKVDTGVGTAFIEIIRRVIEHGHDLVILPPDQPGGLVGLSRATTTMHLLRKCPVPVWVYRPEVPAGRDVIAAVGPFDDGLYTDLDRKLVEMGSSLALQTGARFHLLHAWRLEGESLLRRGRVRLSAEEVDELVRSAESESREALSKLIADTGLAAAEIDVHFVHDTPVAAITAVAHEVDAGVVVMGSLAHGGVAGMLIGSTAETTLASLGSSILAVKPDDFMSPVQPVTGPGSR